MLAAVERSTVGVSAGVGSERTEAVHCLGLRHGGMAMASGKQRMVLGQVSDLDHARLLYVGLQNAGIDQGDIRFGGENAQRAEEQAQQPEGAERINHRVVRQVWRRAVLGAVLGVMAGVVAGALLGLVAGLVFDVNRAGASALGATVLCVLGGVLGAFISAERGMGIDDEWELALADVDGPIWVV